MQASSPNEVLLKAAVLEHKHFQGSSLNEKAATSAKNSHFTRTFNQCKSTSISKLYQPLETPLLHNTFYELLSKI